LAELKARRAELDAADYNDYKSSTKHRIDTATKSAISSTPLTSAASTVTRSDILESYHTKRSLSSSATNPSTQSTKADLPSTDVKANGKASPVRSVSYVPQESGRESKITNGTTLTSKSLGLSTGSSFSKADYGSSRGTQLDDIKASVRLNRSNSARVTPTIEVS